MCGIAGIFSKSPRDAAFWVSHCSALSAALKHRGPDDEGFVLFAADGSAQAFRGSDSDEAVQLPHISSATGTYTGALVHRRLSIVGLGPAGHQPFNALGSKRWLVYNGEAFNFKELDAAVGAQNQSGTDTETVFRLWHEDGESCFRMDGFYAMALFDPETGRLELRRDPTGVKPLYTLEQEDLFMFASEQGALVRLAADYRLDSMAVFHMLAEGVFVPGIELFSATMQVRDGLSVDVRSLEQSPFHYPEPDGMPDTDLATGLSDAVRRRLLSDVPLGFAVSGGVDSAAVIGLARKHLGAGSPLTLFSITSSDPGSDERHWQQQVADYHQATWHHYNIEDSGPHLLEEVAMRSGLPAVAWNNLAHFELCRLTRQHGVTVLFNGQGADELFGGYPDYVIGQFPRYLSFIMANQARMPFTVTAAAKAWLSGLLKESWLGDAVYPSVSGVNHMLGKTVRSNRPFLWQIAGVAGDARMSMDYYGQKLNQMLMWEDRNGMAHQLESRNPFADDIELARWLNVPLRDKLSGGYLKGVLREAVSGTMPDTIRFRVDKKGFTVPDAALTWKQRHHWEPLFMSSSLDEWSPRPAREKLLKNLQPHDIRSLRWYFRLSSFSAFLSHWQHPA